MAMPSVGPFAPLPGVFSQGFTAPQASGGMFGGGKLGIGQAIVAALNGYLAGMGNPAGLANMRMLQEAAQYKRDRADKAAERQQNFDDQIALYDYKLAHPAPVNNDTVADYQFISQTLGPDAGKQFLQTKTNPIVMTPYGPMPYSAVTGAQQPEILQTLPPGAKPIGGAGPSQAPQTFPY